MGSEQKKADENEKRLKTLREYFAKWKVDAESSETESEDEIIEETKHNIMESQPTNQPMDEFPNNTDLNYQDTAHCCRRRCYPHEPCEVER